MEEQVTPIRRKRRPVLTLVKWAAIIVVVVLVTMAFTRKSSPATEAAVDQTLQKTVPNENGDRDLREQKQQQEKTADPVTWPKITGMGPGVLIAEGKAYRVGDYINECKIEGIDHEKGMVTIVKDSAVRAVWTPGMERPRVSGLTQAAKRVILAAAERSSGDTDGSDSRTAAIGEDQRPNNP